MPLCSCGLPFGPPRFSAVKNRLVYSCPQYKDKDHPGCGFTDLNGAKNGSLNSPNAGSGRNGIQGIGSSRLLSSPAVSSSSVKGKEHILASPTRPPKNASSTVFYSPSMPTLVPAESPSRRLRHRPATSSSLTSESFPSGQTVINTQHSKSISSTPTNIITEVSELAAHTPHMTVASSRTTSMTSAAQISSNSLQSPRSAHTSRLRSTSLSPSTPTRESTPPRQITAAPTCPPTPKKPARNPKSRLRSSTPGVVVQPRNTPTRVRRGIKRELNEVDGCHDGPTGINSSTTKNKAVESVDSRMASPSHRATKRRHEEREICDFVNNRVGSPSMQSPSIRSPTPAELPVSPRVDLFPSDMRITRSVRRKLEAEFKRLREEEEQERQRARSEDVATSFDPWTLEDNGGARTRTIASPPVPYIDAAEEAFWS